MKPEDFELFSTLVKQRSGTVEEAFRETLETLPARDVKIAQRVLDALSAALA